MADNIDKADKELNSDSTVKCWHYSFSVESGSDKNSFAVVVQASEMTDPTDKAEATTKAKAKATTIKNDWVTDLATATSLVNEPTEEGAVTL